MKYYWRGPKLPDLFVDELVGRVSDRIDLSKILDGEVTLAVNRGDKLFATVTLPRWAVYRPETYLWTAPNGKKIARATGRLIPELPAPATIVKDSRRSVRRQRRIPDPTEVGYASREFSWGYRPPRLASAQRQAAAVAAEFRQLGLKQPSIVPAKYGDERENRSKPWSVLREKNRRAWKVARQTARDVKWAARISGTEPEEEMVG